MKHLHGSRVFVQSAGVHGGAEVDGFAVEALREAGIDISRHRPRSFKEMEAYGEDFSSYDLMVSFTPSAHRRGIEYTRSSALDVAYWPTMDPSIVEGSRDQRLDAYRALRDGLWERIEREFGGGSG